MHSQARVLYQGKSMSEQLQAGVVPVLTRPKKPVILIVDQDPSSQELLRTILEEKGFRVKLANSGRLAIRSASVTPPDLVFLDITLSDMSSYEVNSLLKNSEVSANTPVVFVSTEDNFAQRVKVFEEGGADYLVKPFHPSEIEVRVRTQLRNRQENLSIEAAENKIKCQVAEKTQNLNLALEISKKKNTQDLALLNILQLSMQDFSLKEFISNTISLLSTEVSCLSILKLSAESECEQSAYQFGSGVNASERSNIIAMAYASQKYLETEGMPTALLRGWNSPINAAYLFADLSQSEVTTSSKGYYQLQPIIKEKQCLGVLVLGQQQEREPKPEMQGFYKKVAEAIAEYFYRLNFDSSVERMAFHDELTGLPNRRLFEERVEQEVKIDRRNGVIGAILYLDLDGFKQVNDELGHDAGDTVLQLTAERLIDLLRSTDTCSRWGGDEFVVLIPGLAEDRQSASQRAWQVADKIREKILQPYSVGGHEIDLSISIGISLIGGDSDIPTILSEADAAMYEAKRMGKNTICCFRPEYQSLAERRLTLIKGLRQAITKQELRLVYQPQVNQRGDVVGLEALMRWHREGGEDVAPDEFIPLAEESKLIVEMGEWALMEACSQLRRWIDAGLIPASFGHLAVNVSPKQFNERNFVESLQQVLQATNVSPKLLEIEVTERLMMAKVEDVIIQLGILKKMGVSFSIDDFGTGYSSLAYLLRLPLDMLKIDRSFVTEVHQNKQAAAIVATIIGMAKSLGIATIAEGVEDANEHQFLQKSGCDYFQGFGLYRPMEAVQVSELFESSLAANG